MKEDMVKRFEANYRRFLEGVREHPAPEGAQLLMAGQQAEIEAYAETFGEPYMAIYRGIIVAGGLDLSFLETVRAQIKETPLNEVVEQFKDGFREILVEVAKLPAFEAISYGNEFRKTEARLAAEFTPQWESRFELAYWPVEEGQFTAPYGWHILGWVCLLFGERVIGYKEV